MHITFLALYRLLLTAMLIFVFLPALPVTAGKVRLSVSAYHSHRHTSSGSHPHTGTCAGPQKWHGYIIHVPGMGRYKVTDTCRRGIDIWLPSRGACTRFGRRTMTVTVIHPAAKKKPVKHHSAKKQIKKKPVKHTTSVKHHVTPKKVTKIAKKPVKKTHQGKTAKKATRKRNHS